MNRRLILGNRTRLILLLFIALIVVFWIWGYISRDGIIYKLVEIIQKNDSNNNVFLSLGIFWLFAVASVLLGPFTSAPLVPIALILWGNWVTFWILLSGWITGGMISYSIGRHLGHSIVARIITQEKIKTWDEFISSRMTFLFALLFRLAMPAETGYIFGLARYSFIKYMIITAFVEILTAVALIFSGEALIDQNFVGFISWVAIIVILIGATAYILANRARKHAPSDKS